MKRFLKSSLSLVLALTIVLGSAYAGLSEVNLDGLFTVKSSAASESVLTFEINEDGKSYSVVGCIKSLSGEYIIPATYDNMPVTNIGADAFSGCINLTSVIIPDSVTSVGDNAFTGCKNLISITISDSVTSIGAGAFSNCKSLTSITIPSGVTSIGADAFSGCTGLTAVHITDLASWNSISFANAFSNPLCYAKNLYLNGELVTNLTIPNGVTKIDNYAFADCDSITSVAIPDSVTTIGDYAFYGCDNLTSVTVPSSVTSIGVRAFDECTNLIAINIDNSKYSSVDGVLFNHDKTVLIQYPDGKSDASYTVPDSVTEISAYAFSSCKSLKSVTIPDSVTKMGEGAFHECTSLSAVYITDIALWCNIVFYDYSSNPLYCAGNLYLNDELVTDLVVPDGVTKIGDYAFRGCKSLKSVTIPDSVTSIGDDAFEDCTGLTSVSFGANVKSIGEDSFFKCTNLTAVNITDMASWCKIDFANAYSNPLYYAGNLYLNGELVTDLVIPDSITRIRFAAFYKCESITSVTIPDSVTSIENSAFYNCSNLTSVIIPKSVTSVGYYAFEYCTSLSSVYISDIALWCNISFYNHASNPLHYAENLYLNHELVTDLVIPNGVTRIGDYAFRGCKSLNNITIPDSVTSIGKYAFYNCTNLPSVSIPNSITDMGYYAFEYCTNLTAVYISDVASWCGISFANASSNPLYCAKNLYLNGELVTDLVIPNSVISICDYAFENCANLDSVAIPFNVTEIGNSVFVNCTNLKYVFYKGTENEWSAVSIGSENEPLVSGVIHFESSDHTYSTEWTIDKEATCTETGIKSNHCEVCDARTGETVIEKLPHTSSDWIIDQEPTCTEEGSKHKECTVCQTLLETASIEKLPHTSSDWIIDKETTCTEEGSKHKECTVCHTVLETESIEKLPHTSSDWIIDKEATCTEEGSKHKECTECHTILETASIEKLEHIVSIWMVDKLPTCTEKGSKHKECNVCHTVLETDSIEKQAHKRSDWITDAPATDDSVGAKHIECTECGKILEEDIIPRPLPSTVVRFTLENLGNGVKISWKEACGADEYIIYRKEYINGKWETSWTEIGSSESLNYIDTDVKSGKSYKYTIKTSNTTGVGGFNETGFIIKYLEIPKLTGISNGSGKVTIKWSKVSGASSYTVYRKTYSNGKWSGWSKVGTTKNNYFNDTKVSSGKYYKYTVRATSGDYTSYYNTSGLKIKYLAVASLKSATSQKAGVKVTWGKVTGAKGYEVYRKTYTNGKWSGWTKIKTVSSGSTISYTDKSAKKGVTYKYTIRAISDSNKGYYNTSGLQVKDKY